MKYRYIAVLLFYGLSIENLFAYEELTVFDATSQASAYIVLDEDFIDQNPVGFAFQNFIHEIEQSIAVDRRHRGIDDLDAPGGKSVG